MWKEITSYQYSSLYQSHKDDLRAAMCKQDDTRMSGQWWFSDSLNRFLGVVSKKVEGCWEMKYFRYEQG